MVQNQPGRVIIDFMSKNLKNSTLQYCCKTETEKRKNYRPDILNKAIGLRGLLRLQAKKQILPFFIRITFISIYWLRFI